MYIRISSPKIKFCLEGGGHKEMNRRGGIQTFNLIEYIKLNFYMREGGEYFTSQYLHHNFRVSTKLCNLANSKLFEVLYKHGNWDPHGFT